METLPLAQLRETFILRVWRDSGRDGEWRGQVQCVSTGEIVTLLGTENIFEHLRQQLDEQVSKQESQKGLR